MDKVKIANALSGLMINEAIVSKFTQYMPKGRHAALSSKTLATIIGKDKFFQNLNRAINVTFVGSLAEISLVNYSIPFGSGDRGRFIMVTEADRQYALDYLERNNYDYQRWTDPVTRKQSVGENHSIRYNAIKSVPLWGERDTVVTGEVRIIKRRKNKKERIKVNEKKKYDFEMPEDTCVTFNEDMDLIVVAPKAIKGGIGEYEMPVDVLGNTSDVIERALHLGKKDWVTKEILIDFITLALNKL